MSNLAITFNGRESAAQVGSALSVLPIAAPDVAVDDVCVFKANYRLSGNSARRFASIEVGAGNEAPDWHPRMRGAPRLTSGC